MFEYGFGTCKATKKKTRSGVEVITENTLNHKRTIFKAKYMISSIPTNQYVHVEFTPELPAFKRNVFKSMQMGNLIKFIVTYKQSFWRNNGFSGEVVSDGSIVTKGSKGFPTIGPVNLVYDGTTLDGEPALVGFIGGRTAVEWLDQSSELRKKEILICLVRFFGEDANDYIDFYEKSWSEEKFSGGCPTASVCTNGVMKDYVRATREPFHNVHFCGAESATRWQGYIDGAAESGIRAANEVLFQLNRHFDMSIKFDLEKTYYFQSEEAKENKLASENGFSLFDFCFGLFFSALMLLMVLGYSYVFLSLES